MGFNDDRVMHSHCQCFDMVPGEKGLRTLIKNEEKLFMHICLYFVVMKDKCCNRYNIIQYFPCDVYFFYARPVLFFFSPIATINGHNVYPKRDITLNE